MDYAILLPQNQSLLTNPNGEFPPLISQNNLQLVAWNVSGMESVVKTFSDKDFELLCAAWRKRATQKPGIIGQVGEKLIPLPQL